MSELRVTVFPVAKMDVAELEGALLRVSKTIHRPVELREPVPLPRGSEEAGRGQHRAAELLAGLRARAATSGVSKLVGASTGGNPVPAPNPDATVFVTDADIFLPNTDGVFAHVAAASKSGVISVRRLREAFYRRKADPGRQRTRLVKELLKTIGHLSGLPECPDPGCVLGPAQVLPDIDRKGERYCPKCWRRLSTGVVRF